MNTLGFQHWLGWPVFGFRSAAAGGPNEKRPSRNVGAPERVNALGFQHWLGWPVFGVRSFAAGGPNEK